MGKKKQDRTKQYHFKLVNRSMADPEHDMPDSGQHVLVPYVPENLRKKGFKELEAPGAKFGLDESVFGIHDNLDEDEKERYERRIYGLKDADVDEVLPGPEDAEALDGDCYFPADGYDYERHLRVVRAVGHTVGSAPPGFAPQSEADDAYKYGKARQRMGKEELALQAALDDDEGYEEADDDFFDDLMEEAVGDEDVLGPALWGGDAALPAPAEVDAEFDAVLDEYDDHMLGAMESFPEGLEHGDQIEDYDEVLDDYLAAPDKQKQKIAEGLDAHLEEEDDDDEECRVGHAQRTLALVPDDAEAELLEDELARKFDRVTVKEDVYDCESVLSLRSNTSNHPGKICRPEKQKKEKKLKTVDEDAEEVVELPEVSTLRPKGETPEERKARKAAVKEHQRMSRALKKETKELFKQERTKAMARVVNAGDLRDGVKHFAL